jgi:hypothetical protein
MAPMSASTAGRTVDTAKLAEQAQTGCRFVGYLGRSYTTHASRRSRRSRSRLHKRLSLFHSHLKRIPYSLSDCM